MASDGMRAAKMEAIAATAGVAVGTLYNHFEHRAALVDALLQARQAELLEHLDEELEAHQRQPFVEQLCAFVEAALDFFAQHGPFVRVFLEAEHQPLEKQARRGDELLTEVRRRLEILLHRGAKTKALRQDPSGVCGWLVLGALRAMLVRQAQGEARETVETQRAMLVRFVLQGLEAKR